MARIPSDEIERLKREISVARLAEARGVALTSTGSNLLGLCPFHNDHQPSLVITPATNLWHCLGACQAGGSVIDWVMRAERVSFRHAVELLRGGAALAGGDVREPSAWSGRRVKRKLEALAGRDANDAELLERVVQVYQAALVESPDALAYLAARGLEPPELVAHFRLGYANRTLGYRLLPANRMEGAALRGRLVELGVYRESGHEHLTGSIVVPLFDAEGRVVNLYGRKVLDHVRPGTPKHLYLRGPHRGVFNREGLAGVEEIVLCEALFDALTFWCAGVQAVTSAYGVEGATDEVLEAIAHSGARRVKIAFDRDDAGDAGAEKVSQRLSAMGIETYRVLFPRGMDANAYARKVQPADKALELVVRQAVWMRAGRAGATSTPNASSTASAEPIEATGPEPCVELAALEPIPFLAADPTPPSASTSTVNDAVEAASTPAPTSPPAPAPTTSAPSPRPAAPAPPAVALEAQGDELVHRAGDRRWRVRLVGKQVSGELRANVLVARQGADGADASFFVDTLDLYAARQRAAYAKAAAAELELDERVVGRELGQLVLGIEQAREAAAAAASASASSSPEARMTADEHDEAMELLRDPRLCDRVLEDLGRAGIVGEETNKLVAYLGATSRKLDEPLAIVIQSSSAAGKSSLMDAVLSLVPEEDRVQYSAMTGQSLFYMSGQDLKHKVLAVVEEQGAERASYALKLLQSEGQLSIASTGKDPATGRHVTHTYRVEGPVMIFLTTTAIEVDEELMNRCLVLSVDEGREQTRAIHERQRRAQTLEGLFERQERERIRRVHQNAQRLLRPLAVVNPFAPELCFTDHATRTRRDHMKYLTLIRAVALLHQHQRPVRTVEHRGRRLEYIEVTRSDVVTASRLGRAVLGHSLDELPPQTRRLLDLLYERVCARAAGEGVRPCDVRFGRRELREAIGWTAEQLRVHLGRLVELEYLGVHRGRRGQSFEYELVYAGEGDDGQRFVLGLRDAELGELEGDERAAGEVVDDDGAVRDGRTARTTPKFGGSGSKLQGGYQAQTGLIPGGTGVGARSLSLGKRRLNGASSDEVPKNTYAVTPPTGGSS